MKIKYIELAGFRGFKNKTRLEFSDNITVITGRNGVGKSTFCDAIEFILTGKISKYIVEQSALEDVSDYIWWRGSESASEHFVKICFVNENGNNFEFKRSRNEGLSVKEEELVDLLLIGVDIPQNPLEQLCKTSIVRDESIAAQSLDIKESERFKFVHEALGNMDGEAYLNKIREVRAITKKKADITRAQYHDLKIRQDEKILISVGEKSKATSSEDLKQAIINLQKIIPGVGTDISDVIKVSNQFLSVIKVKLLTVQNVESEIINTTNELSSIESNEYLSNLADMRTKVEKLSLEKLDINERESDALNLLNAELMSNELVNAYAMLVEGGRDIGLQDGHCPLCDAERSQQEYLAGIVNAEIKGGDIGKRIINAREKYEILKNTSVQINVDLSSLELQLASYAAKKLNIENKLSQIDSTLRDNSIVLKKIDNNSIQQMISSLRSDIIEVERNTDVIENSNELSISKESDALINDLKKQTTAAYSEMQKWSEADVVAKKIEQEINRTKMKAAEDKLFSINPLLKEIYERLRPHSDWRTIEYSLRGDITRLLSLKVGDNLNPQFIFSSGQRRVVGIAFLLSVYLTRAWSQLHTIVLDDPVQHIDDYRAFNIVEVLWALRRDNHQIICTVEDSALADLLTRRLSSTNKMLCRRYDISRAGNQNIKIDMTDITSMPSGILREVSFN